MSFSVLYDIPLRVWPSRTACQRIPSIPPTDGTGGCADDVPTDCKSSVLGSDVTKSWKSIYTRPKPMWRVSPTHSQSHRYFIAITQPSNQPLISSLSTMSDFVYADMSYCSLCDRYFPGDEARAAHVQMSANHPKCELCDRRFANRNSLRNVSLLFGYSKYIGLTLFFPVALCLLGQTSLLCCMRQGIRHRWRNASREFILFFPSSLLSDLYLLHSTLS